MWTMRVLCAAPRTAAAEKQLRDNATSPSRRPVLCVTRLLFWRAGTTLKTESKSNPSWRLIRDAAAPTLAAGKRRCFLVFLAPLKVNCYSTRSIEGQVLFCSIHGISPSHTGPLGQRTGGQTKKVEEKVEETPDRFFENATLDLHQHISPAEIRS